MNPNLLLRFNGLFSISVFFINIYYLERIVAAAKPKIEDCMPKSCGSIKNISYPFWIEGQQPLYCGNPGFSVNCSDGIPYLQTAFGDNQILDIFYNNESIRLSETKLLDHVCLNSVLVGDYSFIGTPFNISAVNEKLLFHNCSGEQDGSFRLPCNPLPNISVAYIGDDFFKPDPQISKDCQTKKIPVLGYAGAESRDYEKLLELGYLLDWEAPNYCTECRASKGQCGYDDSENSFMCICHDRTHRISCSSKSTKQRIIIG